MSPVRPVSHVKGIVVYIWDPSRPKDEKGRRWRPAGYLVIQGQAGTTGNFMYFPDYDGPPLDPLHLDYRPHPPGTPFFPPKGQSLFGVFRDALPGAFGMSLLSSYFPEFGRMSDLEKLAWFGHRTQGGLLFVPDFDKTVVTPERYISGMALLKAAYDRIIKGQLLKEFFQKNPTPGAGAPEEAVLDRKNVYPFTSHGGYRPKAEYEAKDGSFYIAKFNKPEDPYESEVDVEHTILELARRVGLKTAESHVATLPGSQERVLFVKRFDRSATERKHCLTFRTLLGLTDADFYHTRIDTRDIGKAMTAVGMGRDQQTALIKTIAFRAAISDTDDNPTNWGVTLNGETQQWEMAPLYDMIPDYGKAAPFRISLSGIANTSQVRNANFLRAIARSFPDRAPQEVESLVKGVWRDIVHHIGAVVQDAHLTPRDRKRLGEALDIPGLRAVLQGEPIAVRTPKKVSGGPRDDEGTRPGF